MPGLKSRFVLGLIKNRHLFSFQLRQKPFDSSPEGISALRKKTEKAGRMFGKIPKNVSIDHFTIGAMYAEWLRIPEADEKKALLYFHGGMYVIGSTQSHRQHVVKFVKGGKIKALVFDYRLAPEHPFPEGLEDALAAYEYLLDEGFEPNDIAFAGDSAGGGLCLATLLALKDKGIALPAAVAVLSPWTDLALTGESYTKNAKACVSPEGSAQQCSGLYVGENDPKNPWISPLYGDLSGLPPLHISAGSEEILLDDAVRFAEKARQAGVDVTLVVGEGLCHCFPAFSGIFPEATQVMDEIGHFLCKQVHRWP